MSLKILRFIQNYSGHCTDLNLVDWLISKIIKPLCDLSSRYFSYKLKILSTLLRVIFYASEATISDCDTLSECVLQCMEYGLYPLCPDDSHTHMAMIIILGNKMSEPWFLNFLKPNIIFIMRNMLMGNEDKMCFYLDCLRTLYDRLNLEKKLEMDVPTWLPLLETRSKFNEQCLTEALRYLAQLIEVESLTVQQFIQSEVLHKIQFLLSNPSEVGETTFVIKSFLMVFIKFEVTGNHHVYNSRTFKNLVRLLGETLVFLITSLKVTFHGKTNTHDTFPLSIIDRLEKDIIITLKLLQSLYVLNGSWHQWFDIEEEHKLIDDNIFRNLILYVTLRDLLRDGTTKLSWFIELLKICPAVLNFSLRKQMLIKTLPTPVVYLQTTASG